MQSFDDSDAEIEFPNLRLPLRHSGVGVASFVLSLVFGALSIGLGLATSVANIANSIGHGADDPLEKALRLAFMASLCGNLVGLCLGLPDMKKTDRKVAYAALGVAFNGVVLLMGGGFLYCYWQFGL